MSVNIAYRPAHGWVLTTTDTNGERTHYGTYPTRAAATYVALQIRNA